MILWRSCLSIARQGKGAGHSTKFYTSPHPRSIPLPFYKPFLAENRIPFRIPSIGKWYPFHMSSLKHCIPFNCCKFIVLEVCWLFQSHIIRSFTDHNDRFPYPFISFNQSRSQGSHLPENEVDPSTSEILTLIPELWKRFLLLGVVSCIGHYRGVPP